jgi:hypothetical protein
MKVSKSKSFIITRIQVPIQLAVIRTIHRSQKLSLDELVFDPTNIKKMGYIYSIILHSNKIKNIFVNSYPT